jgi:hypothetical protein
MARKMRSGTLVGPGTNRKLRPGLLAPAIVSPLEFLPTLSRIWSHLAEKGC